MKDTSYTRGTKRVEIEEPEAHWAWGAVGYGIAMLAIAWLGTYLAERLVG